MDQQNPLAGIVWTTPVASAADLQVGQLFYVQEPNSLPLALAEIVRLWDANTAKMCQLRFYLRPEDTTQGRQPHHGEVSADPGDLELLGCSALFVSALLTSAFCVKKIFFLVCAG